MGTNVPNENEPEVQNFGKFFKIILDNVDNYATMVAQDTATPPVTFLTGERRCKSSSRETKKRRTRFDSLRQSATRSAGRSMCRRTVLWPKSQKFLWKFQNSLKFPLDNDDKYSTMKHTVEDVLVLLVVVGMCVLAALVVHFLKGIV